jgi:hypothetical protein
MISASAPRGCTNYAAPASDQTIEVIYKMQCLISVLSCQTVSATLTVLQSVAASVDISGCLSPPHCRPHKRVAALVTVYGTCRNRAVVVR